MRHRKRARQHGEALKKPGGPAPFDEWPRGLTKEKLTEEVTREFESVFPGVIFNFSQYISDNVEEARLSGTDAEREASKMTLFVTRSFPNPIFVTLER